MIVEITPQELKTQQDSNADITLLDVRTTEEHDLVNLGGIHIPLGELSRRFEELKPADNIIVYCHHGIRSAQAVGFLSQVGFTKVKNLKGGIDWWAQEVDKEMVRY